MTILLAIIAGATLGYVLERGDLCFHSTWRGLLVRPPHTDLLRAYLLLLLLATPIVQLMVGFGWIDPWIPPLNWTANLVGGMTFGIGMVIAATCITGMFYKLGHGMIGTVVAIAGWALGDIITYRGPLSGFRDDLNANTISIDGQSATVPDIATGTGLAGIGWLLVIGAGAVIARYLYRGRSAPGARKRDKLWGWGQLGLGLTAVTALAWLLVTVDGGDYSYGTAGVPSELWDLLTGSEGELSNLWIPIALVSIAPGAFVAARLAGTLWVRGETTGRYLQLGIGGTVMGLGGGIAGGCNLGHSMVGVPLLSLGSMATTLSMIGGVIIGDRVVRIYRRRLDSTSEAEPTSKPKASAIDVGAAGDDELA